MHTTSSQTIGPYLHIGMTWLVDENLAPRGRRAASASPWKAA